MFHVHNKEETNTKRKISNTFISSGKRSAGSETENKKTGVDSSISGAMYQMRPYPSAAMVLQVNAKNESDNNDGE